MPNGMLALRWNNIFAVVIIILGIMLVAGLSGIGLQQFTGGGNQ
jgi:hypothetical protein